MPDRGMPLTLVVRTLDESILTAEPLLFPELHCCDRKEWRLRATVRDLAKEIAENTPAFALHRREMPGDAHVEQVDVTLAPPKHQTRWSEEIVLRFDVVRWRHRTEAYLAFVPALGIEVLAAREGELKTLIPEHIIAALRRSKAADSLYELALTQRTEAVRLEPLSLSISVKSPRQRERDADKEENQKPVIKEIGLVLSEQTLAPAYELGPLVERLAESLVGRNARSVLLVGPSGVGKTAAVHELVRARTSHGLGSTPFWSTSGSRLIAGMSGFGMWQQRCRRLCQEAKREGAVLHLGNLIELMEVGRGGAGGQGIAGFLRPYLGRGDVLAIAECTPEQLPLIERENPHLLEVFQQIKVEEPSPETGRRILQLYADSAGEGTIALADGALEALDRLHRRYATYSAYPGRPARFLRNLLKDRSKEHEIGPREVIAAFSRETGLPLFMLDPAVPLDLSEARDWFRQRVIGQERAVDLVIDLLATVKAALTRPRRPIASLLFIGPTGVGKTELAKALAEFFFGDRNRLTRFDMSEFAGGTSVERLIGGAFGAEGLLTSKVREQPFSVILFDEFEKAHWGFFDLLLQVLGEGRLTDAAGRLADFSNTLIVMTSNIGADRMQPFGLSKQPPGTYDSEVTSFFRPEFFNRIDAVVNFDALDAGSIRQIAEAELRRVGQREGIQRSAITLEWGQRVVELVCAEGFDPRYGARPLQRVIETRVVTPLAKYLSHHHALQRARLKIDVNDMGVAVVTRGG